MSYAKCNDNTTWSNFGKAIAFAKRYGCDGIAFALEGSGYTCIDLDHHIKNGDPSELAQRFINASTDTYVERSVSGSGLHIFYKGSRPNDHQNRNLDLDLEIYDGGRFISMTGNVINENVKSLSTPSAELQNLVGTYFPKVIEYTTTPSPLGMDDNAVIELISKSKRGRDFDLLYSGVDTENDHSRSDFKLCNILGFFTGGDTAQVERIFRSSGLYRPQKGEPYVKHTVEKACKFLSSYYDPNKYKYSKNKSRTTKKDGFSMGE